MYCVEWAVDNFGFALS